MRSGRKYRFIFMLITGNFRDFVSLLMASICYLEHANPLAIKIEER